MIQVFQVLDASFLIGSVLGTVIILQRDYQDAHLLIRASAVIFACFAYAQAMWLLGVWVPSSAGFPWPRAALDGTLFMAIAVRVWLPVRQVQNSRRRITL